MAKTKNVDLLGGLRGVGKAVGLSARGMGAFYHETPQVKGRISRALAKETPRGKGKIAMRPSYKRDMVKGLKQQTRQERGKIVFALARNTKGGTGKIVTRPAHRKHVPMR